MRLFGILKMESQSICFLKQLIYGNSKHFCYCMKFGVDYEAFAAFHSLHCILVNDKSMTAEPVGYFTLAYSQCLAPVMNCNASNIISSGFCTISKHFYIPFIIVIVDMFTVICQICI